MSFINDIRHAIENYKTALEATNKEQAGTKGMSIFVPPVSPQVEFLNRLAQGLHENMSVKELAEKIAMLENTQIVRSTWLGASSEVTTVGVLCKEKKQSILLPSSLTPPTPIENQSRQDRAPLGPTKTKKGTDFFTLLTDMHESLYRLYATAQKNQQFHEMSRDEIQQSPYLRRVENCEGFTPRSALVDFGRSISVEGITFRPGATEQEKYEQINTFTNNNRELTDLMTSFHQGVHAEIHYAIGDKLTTIDSRNLLISGGTGVVAWKKDHDGNIYAEVQAWATRLNDTDSNQLYCLDAETRGLMKIVNVDMDRNRDQYRLVDADAFEYEKITPGGDVKQGEVVKELEPLLDTEKSQRSLEVDKRREILPRIYTVTARIDLKRVGEHYRPVVSSAHVVLNSLTLNFVNKNQRTVSYTNETVARRPLFTDFERAATGKGPKADIDSTLWAKETSYEIESMRIITNERLPKQPVLATFIALHSDRIVPERIISEFESQLRVMVEPVVSPVQSTQSKKAPVADGEQGWTVYTSKKTGEWKWENNQLNYNLAVEVFSLKSKNGEPYVLDSETNKLRRATAEEARQLVEGGYKGSPIAIVKSVIQLNNVNGHAVPVLKKFGVSFNTQDTGLHAERGQVVERAVSAAPAAANVPEPPSSSPISRAP